MCERERGEKARPSLPLPLSFALPSPLSALSLLDWLLSCTLRWQTRTLYMQEHKHMRGLVGPTVFTLEITIQFLDYSLENLCDAEITIVW